jgi:hypothetical protein
MNTQWNQIPNFESYEASSNGNIRNLKTKKLLARCGKDDGYLYVTMYHNKKYHNRSIHTMVARTFLPNPDNKPTVNHKDRNGLNNSLDNLEWATHKEQQLHVQSTGGKSFQCRKQEVATDLPDEKWKTFEDDFSVSTHGRIKNKNGLLMNCHTDKRGYVYVSVKGKTKSVHRIVSQAFIGQLSDNMVVNHKDGDKGNNNVTNLEIVSQSFNVQHAYDMGLNVKLNKRVVYQVDYQGNVVAMHDSLTSAENNTGINRGSIHNAIESGCTSHGYRWFKSMEDIEKERYEGLLIKDFFKVIQCNHVTQNIVAVYDSYPQAKNATDTSVTNISRSCKTNLKAGGFKWFQCYQDYLNHKW